MDKKNIVILALVVALVAVLGYVFGTRFLSSKKPAVTGQESGIMVSAPKAMATIQSPLTITGSISGNGWAAFEAQAGTVKLLDENGNQLALGILTVTDENWMKENNNFSASLSFVSSKDQDGVLEFRNENASGDPERDKVYKMSVKIKAGGAIGQTEVKVFFPGKDMGSNYDCATALSVVRKVTTTPAIGRAALEELLQGPTKEEQDAGYTTTIPAGVKIQNLTIENGVARADFDETLERQVGGSCRVTAIRSQITQTLKQFSTVKDVIISIDGRVEDILQP